MSNNKTSKVVVDATKYPASAGGMKVNMADAEAHVEEYGWGNIADEEPECIYCQTFTKYIDAMDHVLILQRSLAQELCILHEMADSALNLCSDIEMEGISSG